jgi:hypothetical protein
LNLSTEQVGNRGCRAAVWHVRHADAGHNGAIGRREQSEKSVLTHDRAVGRLRDPRSRALPTWVIGGEAGLQTRR